MVISFVLAAWMSAFNLSQNVMYEHFNKEYISAAAEVRIECRHFTDWSLNLYRAKTHGFSQSYLTSLFNDSSSHLLVLNWNE